MKETEIQKEKSRRTVRGELALMVAVAINSLGVVLMLHSGAGISAISSVPYAFSEVFTRVSLGTWTYIFQGLLVLSLMILRKKFVPQYLFSFVVGFAFSELLDVHESWINVLPLTPGYRVIYFLISYILLCIGIALSNRCKPTAMSIRIEPIHIIISAQNPPTRLFITKKCVIIKNRK